MEVAEAFAELDLLAVDGDRPERRLAPGVGANGRSAASVERNQRTVGALELEIQPAIRLASRRCTLDRATAPNSQSSRSKKWMPMLVTRPPERSSEPFHDTSYQRPRAVT